jgi:hypothetical protein
VIEEDHTWWKDFPCSRIDRINIVKMVILPKAIYIKIPKCNSHQNPNDIHDRE